MTPSLILSVELGCLKTHLAFNRCIKGDISYLNIAVSRRDRKIVKNDYSFVMSFGLSVRPHGTTRIPIDFHGILYLRNFRQSV